jgi:predicted outer membrane repeat protein
MFNKANGFGGAIFAQNASINFNNSTVAFISNIANEADGGAISLWENSVLSFENSSVTFINNSALGDISYGGAIGVGATLNITNSTLNFIGNVSKKGGAIFLDAGGALNIENANIFFDNNSDYFGQSDIYFSVANIMTLSGDVVFTNGLRATGNGSAQIVKTGDGKVLFAGQNTVIESRFMLNAGTAIFSVETSTVREINMSAGTTLSMIEIAGQTKKAGVLTINSAFTLDGILGMNFDFIEMIGDIVLVNGAITINPNSYLDVSFMAGGIVQFSSIAFLRGDSITGEGNISFLVAQPSYDIKYQDNALWLYFKGSGSLPWDNFVTTYKEAVGTIELESAIKANENDKNPFGHTNIDNTEFVVVNVDDESKTINSNGFEDLGFIFGGGALQTTSATFKGIIGFANFVGTVDGGVFNLTGSTLNFMGEITFRNNNSASKGGAIFGDSSAIGFIDMGVINFSSNMATDFGGAIYLGAYSKLDIANSLVNFTSNIAMTGGAIYAASNSKFEIVNSTVNFYHNIASGQLNDIYLDSGINLELNNVWFMNGLRTAGAGSVRVIGGQVGFGGQDSVLNLVDVVGGEVVFNGVQSSVTVLTIANGASLSLMEIAGQARNDASPATAGSVLYVLNGFGFEGSLGIDFDFAPLALGSDLLFVNGDISIALGSILNINFISTATVSGTSVAFISAQNIIDWNNFELNFLDPDQALAGYEIRYDQLQLWLYYNPFVSDWNAFVEQYKNGGGLLGGDIEADDISNAFESSLENDFTVDGADFSVDAAGFANLGFVLNDSSITFKSISFMNFSRTPQSLAQMGNGGVFILANVSTLNFMGEIGFIQNNSANAGGVIYSSYSGINFMDSVVNFSTNSAVFNGGAMSLSNSSVSINNSLINFSSNAARYQGGAIEADRSEININGSTINFVANTADTYGGGAIYIYSHSFMKVNNSIISFTSNSARFGGAIAFENGTQVDFINSTITFAYNKASDLGGAIELFGDSVIIFENSLIDFVGNTSKGTRNDLQFSGDDSLVIFRNNVELVNGIAIEGAQEIRKDGVGIVSFGGDTIIKTQFSIEQGSAVFASAQSTIGYLNMALGAGLSLVNGQINNLTLLSNSTLSGYLDLDFDFAGATSNLWFGDTIFVNGNLDVHTTTLSVNFINGPASTPTAYGSSVAFIQANSASNPDFLYLVGLDSAAYKVNFVGGNFWLFYFGGNPWDLFVVEYLETTQGQTLILEDTLNASAGSSEFGTSLNSRFTIDGDGHTLNANSNEDLAFVLNASSQTFKNIGFENFNSATYGLGGVFEMVASSVYFKGIVNFKNNEAAYSGAAVNALSSLINIDKSTVIFSGNSVITNFGGAIALEDSGLQIINSFVSFEGNNSDNNGGAVYIKGTKSSMTVINSTINFIGNTSVGDASAIHLYDAGAKFTNSLINFNLNVAGGMGAAYLRNQKTAFENSQVSFNGNNASGGAGAILVLGSSVSFANSVVSFDGNNGSDGGAITIAMGSTLTFVNALVNFTNNVGGAAGAIYTFEQPASLILFMNSTATFSANLAGGTDNDITLSGVNDKLIFDGNVEFTNGIRTAGAGQVRKTGIGQAVFNGEGARIINDFTLEAGSVVFNANQSTVGALTISNGATLLMKAGALTDLTINTNFTLAGFIAMDFDFNSLASDIIRVGGILTVDKSTLSVNLISVAPDLAVSEIAFIIAPTITGFANLTVLATDQSYIIKNHDGALWLFADKTVDYWDEFVDVYKASLNAPISLEGSITAMPTSKVFGDTTGVSKSTVNGNGWTIDAAGKSLGLDLGTGRAMTFKDITFTNFADPVIKLRNSTLVFRGTVSFINNDVAISFETAQANLIFEGSSMTFANNTTADIVITQGQLLMKNSNIFIDKITGAGAGKIEKTGTGVLELNGDNSGFTGNFNQKGGTTTVRGTFFGGASTITASVLTFEDGSVYSAGALAAYNLGRINFESGSTLGANINMSAGSVLNLELGATVAGVMITVDRSTINLMSDTFEGNFNSGTNGNGRINKVSAGDLTIANSANFKGMFVQEAGNTIVTAEFAASTMVINSGAINLSGGITKVDGFVIVGSELNIAGLNNELTFSNRIFGSGTINNESNIKLTNNNNAFTGQFNTSGQVVVSSGFFKGITNVTAGSLQFIAGATIAGQINNAGEIVISGNRTVPFVTGATISGAGTISLSVNSTMTVNGEISATGQINKTTGMLALKGDNSGFGGSFIQTGGITTAAVSALFSDMSIENSVLRVFGNESDIYDVKLNSGAVFEYKQTNNSQMAISGAGLQFNDASAKASFETLTGRGDFVLSQMSGGAQVTINNAKVTFSGSDLSGANFTFNNVAMDLFTGSKTDLSFDSLALTGAMTSLRIGIYHDGNNFSVDTINAGDGSGKVNFTTAVAVNFDSYNDISQTIILDVLSGGITFNISASSVIYTHDAYTFRVSSSITGALALIITNGSDDVVEDFVKSVGDVDFITNIAHGDQIDHYQIVNSLEFIVTGKKTVRSNGNRDAIGGQKISGKLRNSTTNERGTIFIITDDAAQLVLSDIYIEDAKENTSSPRGGSALYLNNAGGSAEINNTVFRNNESAESGGAVNAVNGTLTINGGTQFNSNITASNGGALAIGQGANASINANTNNPVVFSANRATRDGGAIYLDTGANLTINAINADVTFTGNTASNGSNDIYMANAAVLNVNASAGKSVNLNGGISGQGTINKTGEGAIDIKSMQASALEMTAGTAIIRGDVSLSGDLTIGALATYDLAQASDKQTTTANNVYINGTLRVGIYGTRDNASGDLIIANGTIYKTDGSAIVIELDNPLITGKATIMTSVGEPVGFNLTGFVANLNPAPYYAAGIDGQSYVINWEKNSHGIWEGWINITGGLVNLAGLGDTHNRLEAVKILTKMADNGDDEVAAQIAEIRAEDGDKAAKRALDMANGTFLAEVLVQIAKDQNADSLYARLKQPKQEFVSQQELAQLMSSSLWVEYSQNSLDIDHQDNSFLNNTAASVVTVRAGLLIMNTPNTMGGVFINSGNSSIKQETNKAAVNLTEAGFYGGIFDDNSEYKFHISIGQNNISTVREVELINNYSPRGKFSVYALKAGLEAAYVVKQEPRQFSFDIKPYAGARAALVLNDDFSETDGELANLKVSANQYKSFEGFAGLKIESVKTDLSWYVKGEVGYLMAGNDGDSQYQVAFTSTSHGSPNMNIRGLEAEPLTFGAGAGVELSLTEQINVYANGQLTKNVNVTQTEINVGLKILFGGTEQLKDYQSNRKVAQTKARKEKELAQQRARKLRQDKEAAELRKIQEEEELERARILKDAVNKKARLAPEETVVYEEVSDKSFGGNQYEEVQVSRTQLQPKKDTDEWIIVKVLAYKGQKAQWLTPIVISAQMFDDGDGDEIELPFDVQEVIRKKMAEFNKAGISIARTTISRYGPKPRSQTQIDLAKWRSQLIYEHMKQYESVMSKNADKKAQEQQAQKRRAQAQKSFRMKAASFGSNSAKLNSGAKAAIKVMAQEIKNMDYALVTVEGHSDNSGSAKQNLVLSQNRAKTVAKELLNNGIPQSKIRFIGLASTMPLSENTTPQGRQQNRRAEIFVE